ncbi:hypothetical protein [Woeseia oceani]|uniref:Uncharacterized protein n=1 Tax=Woeseia oceani TaxID=1548547 RepID=A0A193LG76_9GAMM|nr:hypothetical protein [Woeseia oceani]ANO51369.1 hypothetical protein BA177_09310 [Woeseia oceani]
MDLATGNLLLAPWGDSSESVAWDIDEQRFSTIGTLVGGGNFDGIEVVGKKSSLRAGWITAFTLWRRARIDWQWNYPASQRITVSIQDATELPCRTLH